MSPAAPAATALTRAPGPAPPDGIPPLKQAGSTAPHERLVDNPPWPYIVPDLNPRAFSKKVKGFVSPQSWCVDLALVSLD